MELDREELEREGFDEENPVDAIWILDGGKLILKEVADDDADD